MTEVTLAPSNLSKTAFRNPVFDLTLDDADAFIKCKETADPNRLVNIMNRIVANSNHLHPRVLSYKEYNIESQPPYWKARVKVQKMKTNLVNLQLSNYYSKTSFTKPELINHFYSLLSALEYLHHKSLPHQNIKPENVLFDDENDAYLSDCAHKNERQESYEPKVNLYTKDIVTLGSIFLSMCSPQVDNAQNEPIDAIIEQTVKPLYGRDVSDFIYQMINASSIDSVTAQTLRQTLETKFANILKPITFKSTRQNNDSISSSPSILVPLKTKIRDIDVIKQNLLYQEDLLKKRTESFDLHGRHYLHMPWKLSKGIKTVRKNGLLKKRELDNLKKCFKLGSPQMIEKLGKKVGFSGIELVQTNNFRTPTTCLTKGTSQAQQLSSCLSKFSYLKDFQIEYNCGNIDCQDLITLGKKLLKLKQLKKLRLRFACGQTLGDNGFILLGHLIQRLTKLEDLNLYLNKWSKTTEKGFEQLCYALSKLDKLKRLVLNIEEFEQIGNTTITKLGQSLAKLPQLTDLDLTLYRCSSIAGPQLANISEYFGKCRNIRKLAINVKQSQGCMDQGLLGIAKAFSSVVDLRELRLNFLGCDLTENSIATFGSALAQLTQLTVLDLTFGNNDKISNKTFEPIAASLAKLTQLKSLKLVFFQCDKLTDGAMFYLAEALTQLKNLGELELNFRWCTLIDDYGIFKLGEALLNLSYLHKIQLALDGCRISDNGVSKLGQDLAKIQYLNDLKLEVRECKRIQGSGISKLGECLTKLVELGQIQLNFCGCGGNYRQRLNEGIMSLKKSISKLPRVHMSDNSIAPYC